MIHPNTELKYINKAIGHGVFATAFIPKGTIVYVIDPLELTITPEQFEAYPEILKSSIDKYSYRDAAKNKIVSWDYAKYVNHCCDCNTMSSGYGFEVAIRDIQEGEEITDEYGMFNIECEMDLHCNSGVCRKKLRKDDFDHYHKEWDGKVLPALQQVFNVDQPLLSLLDDDTRKELEEVVRNPQAYKSVIQLKCGD